MVNPTKPHDTRASTQGVTVTPTQRSAMEQALEALLKAVPEDWLQARDQLCAMNALRAALAETAEPVAKVCHDLAGHIGWNPALQQLPEEGTLLYTAPQPPAPAVQPDPCPGCRKGGVCRTPSCGRLKLAPDNPYRTGAAPAVELTDEELKEMAKAVFESSWDGDGKLVNKSGRGVYLWRYLKFARAAIAAHEAKRGKA
jgi:hypothetical protein